MERGDNFEHYYDIAITYLGKVIKENKHDLKQSYEELWYNECNWTTANNDDVIFAIPMLKSVTSRYGYNVGVTIAGDKHEYGSASNYLHYCGTYMFTFDGDDLRRDVTCRFGGEQSPLGRLLVFRINKTPERMAAAVFHCPRQIMP